MSNRKTLREVCEMYRVTRRAIQGYEKAGLVLPSGKNKYGYLLYDEEAQRRIEQIKLYQQLGFSIREISELITAPKEKVREALEKQILCLEEEKKRKEELIRKAYEILKKLG
ncbi:MAG: MerR family transcriptional regulator [Lachnospiraceae bacterium]|nr:MerR family transcriptional regulator [Lachnospiraceae bacterium]